MEVISVVVGYFLFYIAHQQIVPVYSYDKVTVFYDEKGKKIFEFGLDYDNVERLKADVKNTQKSILKHHSKN